MNSNDTRSAIRRLQQFSHAEALAIAGLSAQALLTWHKRNLAPDTPGREGKGNRRAYSRLDVIRLALVKRLAEAGCALIQAHALAGRLLLLTKDRMRGTTGPGAEYLVLYPQAGCELVPANDLAQWIKGRQPDQVMVIDFGAFIEQLRKRLRDVVELKLRLAAQRALTRRTQESEQDMNRIMRLRKRFAGEAW